MQLSMPFEGRGEAAVRMPFRVGVLGAGPHGQELAAVVLDSRVELFDDDLPGFRPVTDWKGEFVVGAAWPTVRRQIAGKARGVPLYGTGVVVFPGAHVSPTARRSRWPVRVNAGASYFNACSVFGSG